MRKIVKKLEFWVSNISDKNVSLRDLGLTIKSRSNVNLLDDRHYNFTAEQLELSAAVGSLFAKSNLLKVRVCAPEILVQAGPQVSKMPRFIAQNTARTMITVEEKVFEELNLSDEKMADEMTDD
jgi:hypothetical protein